MLTELHTQEADLLVVPGGAKGAETISQNVVVQRLLSKQYQTKKLIGMICAGMYSDLKSLTVMYLTFAANRESRCEDFRTAKTSHNLPSER